MEEEKIPWRNLSFEHELDKSPALFSRINHAWRGEKQQAKPQRVRAGRREKEKKTPQRAIAPNVLFHIGLGDGNLLAYLSKVNEAEEIYIEGK